MAFFDYIRLAFKNLFRQKTRTFLTILAITVGSLSLILMLSIIISIKQSLMEQFQKLGAFNLVTVVKDPNSTNNSLLSSNGDLSEGKKIDDTTLAAVKKIANVSAVTPILSGMSMGTMRLEGVDKKTWANIVAYDPSNDVFDLPLSAGRKLTTTDMDKIMVGNRFTQDVGYKGEAKDLIGKRVLLNYKGGGGNAPDWGPLPEKPPIDASEAWYKAHQNSGTDISAEIVGVTESSTVDSGQSYISLAWGRKLLVDVSWQAGDKNNNDQKNNQNYTPTMTLVKNDRFIDQGYTSIIVKVNDTDNIKGVATAIEGLGYGATTAQSMVDEINKILSLIGIVLAVIGGISLFVAAIGIINTMVMATYERIREIGVMRACGATRATIRRLFTFEAACLGFAGGVLGVTISYFLAQAAKIIVTKYATSLGDLPIDNIGAFPWWLVLSVIGFTTLLGLISGLGPAIKAARLNPVDALRYE
jgi:ABC-type antimicrobial peptide transport system permease subunit